MAFGADAATPVPNDGATIRASSPGSATIAVPETATKPATVVPRRAAGGIGILASIPSASAVVVGVVSQPRNIDLHGWSAGLKVDQLLAGQAASGEVLTMAWEELSKSRPVRFADGERVLVVLSPLPTQSLWRKRFADVEDLRKVRVVAGHGDAFLVGPDGGTLNTLEHYLAMVPNARNGAPGEARLAELVSIGHHSMAVEALEQLEGKTTTLGIDAVAGLLEAAENPGRESSLRIRALKLAARQDSVAVRRTATALSQPGSTLRAPAYEVLAGLPGALPPEQAATLLAAPEPELRVVGIGLIADPGAREKLLGLVREDKDATVRLAAGKALLSRGGASAIADVLVLLDDPDAVVRNGIAGAVGALGSAAVEPLRTVVDTGSERAALAGVLGLARAGKDGGQALLAITHLHPNEAVRTFAKLAVGRGIGHSHEPEEAGHAPE